jgi:thiol-disulfide isomerase/thioredoxin
MKRLGMWFILFVFTVPFCYSQKSEYQLGDTVPDFQINRIINYNKSSTKLSEFNGKLLILDFWATWCAPCIAAMPKLDSIQNRYADKLQILPITYEDSAVVSKFLGRMSKVMGISPPSVIEDNFLRYRFVHTSLPHYVWINPSRRIIAITEAKDVNAENIVRYLNGKELKFKLKKDEEKTLVGFPVFYPTVQVLDGENIVSEKLNDSDLISHTILTNYVDGLSSGATFLDSTYFIIRNSTIASLFKYSFFGNSIIAANTSSVRLDIKDSSLFKRISGKNIDGTKMSAGIETLEWLKGNAYTYESKVPPILAKQRFSIMTEDLNRYFGVKYGIIGIKEKVQRKCLALIRISKDDKIATKGGTPGVQLDKFSFKMNNLRLHSFLDRLTLPLQSYPPIVDETNYVGKVDLDITCNLSDLKALNEELERYGLKLQEKNALLETVVIRKKN